MLGDFPNRKGPASYDSDGYVTPPSFNHCRAAVLSADEIVAFQHHAYIEYNIMSAVYFIWTPQNPGALSRGGDRQVHGTAKTRGAKAIVCRAADGRDPNAGEPRKDRKSRTAGVRIDSARSAERAGRASELPPAWSSSGSGRGCSRLRK